MLAKPTRQDFLANVTDHIAGWLIKTAAHLTLDLLHAQREFDAKGGLLEIGIYEGKSWSLAIREAIETSSPVFGVDTFQFFTEQHVRDKLSKFFPNVDLPIYNGKSTDLSRDRVIEKLGEARFVSIDGSHMAPDVERDLNLASAVLSKAGIISIDDFLNPLTFGVNEGVSRFMLGGAGGLSPFCYCTNKLFMCRPGFAQQYSAVAETFIRNNSQYPESKKFIELDKQWRGAVEIDYFGHPVLSIS